MELFKFINENEIQKYSGGFVVIDNRVYTNPTEEKVKKAGFKPLAEVEQPTFDAETEYLVLSYRDDGDVITQVWAVEKQG